MLDKGDKSSISALFLCYSERAKNPIGQLLKTLSVTRLQLYLDEKQSPFTAAARMTKCRHTQTHTHSCNRPLKINHNCHNMPKSKTNCHTVQTAPLMTRTELGCADLTSYWVRVGRRRTSQYGTSKVTRNRSLTLSQR